MYLILIQQNDRMINNRTEHSYTSFFTDSLVDLATAFRDGDGKVRVFKLDSLTEIMNVDIEISETPKELT